MSRTWFLRGVSAAALPLVLFAAAAKAQQSLPTIDIGGARSSAAQKPQPSPGASRSATGAATPQAASVPPGGPSDPQAYSKPNVTTATKTDAPIMETPVSVQVVPQQVLQDQQVVILDQALRNVSSVAPIANGGLQNGYVIRGFQTFEYYLDGVRVNTFFTPPPRELANIQQVEVLKGPASILYGRLEPGGLINLVRKQPQSDPHVELQQQFGSFGLYRTTFGATGPVTTDKSLLYRFDLAYENEGSFRDLDHSNRIFVAPHIHWEPTADTRANVYLEYQSSRYAVDLGVPTVGQAVAPVPISRNFGSPDAALNTKSDVRAGFNWTHDVNKDWKITHRFDVNVRDQPSTAVIPFGADPANCVPTLCPIGRGVNAFPTVKTQDYFSSLDLTGHFDTFGVAHTILVGGDYYRNHTFATNITNFSTVPGTDLFNPAYTPGLAYQLATPDGWNNQKTDQSWYGIYFQDQMALPYNFHLLAGFRYDDARASGNTVTLIPDMTLPTQTSLHENAIKPRVGLLWRPIPELSFYGDYVENFGLSNPANTVQAPLPPTTAQQWEAGMKTELMDGRFSATFAWFDIVKKNVATPSLDPNLAALGVMEATGAVRNRGVELDMKGQLTSELKLIASYSIIDSRIIEDRNVNNNGVSVIGNHLFAVPHKSGSAWAIYEPEAEPVKGFAFGAGLYGQTKVAIDNLDTFDLPGYITVNAMARYKMAVANTNVSFQLNVDNLLNKGYYTTPGSTIGIFPGKPRAFLGSVKVEF
jgi:iron complex outermembrane recepter protein